MPFFRYIYFSISIHSFIQPFIHNIRWGPYPYLHSYKLSGRNLTGVPKRDSNSGLPKNKPAYYHLSYAAPFWATLHPTELRCTLSELRCTLSDPVLWTHPDQHQSDKPDPDPDRIFLQMTSQNVWNMSLYEHFEVWVFIWKLGSGSGSGSWSASGWKVGSGSASA